MARPLALTMLVLLLAGCVVGPAYERPSLDLPDAWPEQHAVLDTASGQVLGEWWQRFEDPALDGLVARAIAANPDIRLQAARVEEARARLGLARAEQLPTVGVQAEATRQRQPAAAFGLEGFDSPPRNLYSIAGVLGYELDIWGRLAREREAAEAQLQGNVYALEAVRLGVIADVAVVYFNLRGAERQLQITTQTIAAREEGVRIERLRFEAGQIDELNYRQAESELAGARAELPGRIAEISRLQSALGLLIGLEPAELLGVIQVGDGELEDIVLPTRVPAELPSALLARRPDLRAAEAELVAATARVGVAEAARLPQFNLVGLLGTVAGSGADLFGGDAEAWSIGASIAGPLYDFGRSAARVETAEAQRVQAELRYRATAARAFTEVRDALVFYENSGARLAAVRDQADALRRTEALSEIRHREGYISIIELLISQRALLNAELAVARAQADRFTAIATLYKALGGGWEAN